jgi:hypothetical protein
MTLSKRLESLVDKSAYAEGMVTMRWGQMLRANATVASELVRLERCGNLTRFGALGRLRSGVVTRANAFFLVRELPFDQIPSRMHVTRGDMRRIAVIVDGLDYICKVEREFLKPILKGPDSLESAFSIRRSDLRLFDVRASKDTLSENSAIGALAYLKRGETVQYKTSADDLKGGIPAKRSQVKNRKPFWYCIQGEQPVGTRIVFPEHLDRRYVFTLLADDDPSVVIDTLYSFEPADKEDAAFVHAGLNSLLTWYQVELRGRSQHGEGVLKVKLPDYRGVMLANPVRTNDELKKAVMTSFAHLSGAGAGPSLEELGSAQRLAFDVAYLSACGFQNPEEIVILLEQELRALAGERVERKLSVADAKISRRKATNVAASIDAYAARIAATIPPFPDPRSFVDQTDAVTEILITGVVQGSISVGTELFDLGEISADGRRIASTGSVTAALLVRAVLLIDPNVTVVRLPQGPRLERLHREWQGSVKRWQKEFDFVADKVLAGVSDLRTKEAVRSNALTLLHAR